MKDVPVQRYGEAEAVKGFENGVVADLNARVAVNKRLVKAELYRVVTESVLVGECGNHLNSAVVLLEQIQKTGDGCVAHLGVKALFIAHGRVGAVCQTNGGFTNGSRVEGCGFEGEGSGVLNDLGVKTAHDTCDRDGSIVVADHQCVFVYIALHAVQSLEGEGLVKALDADLADLA